MAIELREITLDDPDRLSVAIVVDGVPVGMFALDRGGYLRDGGGLVDQSLCAATSP